MICPTCLGRKTLYVDNSYRVVPSIIYAMIEIPCPECLGIPRTSCCDGAGSAQPEPKDEE